MTDVVETPSGETVADEGTAAPEQGGQPRVERNEKGQFTSAPPQPELIPEEPAPQKGFIREAMIKMTPETDPNVQKTRAFGIYDDRQTGDVFSLPAYEKQIQTEEGEESDEDSETAVVDETPPEGDANETEGEVEGDEHPEAAVPFKFAGEEWESAEKAEANFSTLRGQYKSFLRRVQEAEERAQRAEAQLQEREARVAPQQSAPPVPNAQGEVDPLEEILNSIDEKEIKAAKQLYGEETAQKVALYRALKSYHGMMQKELAQVLQPVHEAQEKGRFVQAGAMLLRDARDLADAEGNPTYPELQDPQEASVVARIWSDLNMPHDFAFSTAGVHAAIAIYRDLARRHQEANPPQQTPKAAPKPVRAAAGTVRPSAGRPPKPQAELDTAQRILKHDPIRNKLFRIEA